MTTPATPDFPPPPWTLTTAQAHSRLSIRGTVRGDERLTGRLPGCCPGVQEAVKRQRGRLPPIQNRPRQVSRHKRQRDYPRHIALVRVVGPRKIAHRPVAPMQEIAPPSMRLGEGLACAPRP